ncbi:MAG: hypothetical protein EA428_13800 [Spirochaetaceae bacterium]|nr:MAG: hypothetical protein EA428_13800 [Spirochaetaceae bacterium]
MTRRPYPNCLQCRYFRVTWEPRFPRSCTVFGIKTKMLPSIAVYRATGRHCPSFELRERRESGVSAERSSADSV